MDERRNEEIYNVVEPVGISGMIYEKDWTGMRILVVDILLA